MPDPIRVLFVCVHNSARSQMAEALLTRDGGDRFRVRSAGTDATGVNPYAIRALAEVGIDWTSARSTPVTELVGDPFDLVVTVCDEAREACPVFPGATRTLHWNLDDPAAVGGTDAQRMAAFRSTRAELEPLIASLVESFAIEANS